MSERITHTAILDDSFRIARRAEGLNGDCGRAMEQHRDLARLASATRWGDRFIPGLLEQIRDRADSHEIRENRVRRLAFVIGWACHRSGDREMKPLFREWAADDNRHPRDCSIYHDAFILKTVYGIGAEEIYPPVALGIHQPSAPEQWQVLRALFHALLEQSLIELHTFIPDPDDPGGWIDRLEERRQGFYIDIERYARIIADPDPAAAKRYIHDAQFYSENDEILAIARAIQNGEAVPSVDPRHLAGVHASSYYGKAVAAGVRYVFAISDFLDGKINRDQLVNTLDTGKPGRDGKAV